MLVVQEPASLRAMFTRNGLVRTALLLGCTSLLSCTSNPPVCYEVDDARRPNEPHLVRNASGQCVRVEGRDSDAGMTDGGNGEGGNREDDAGMNVVLTNLVVGAPAALQQPFSSATTAYDVSAPFLSETIEVTATVQGQDVTLQIAGQNATSGEPTRVAVPVGTSAVEVTVGGPSTTLTYTLNVSRSEALVEGNYFKASNTDADDRFGTSVAVDGDTLVVGAPSESSNATGIDGDQSNNAAEGSGAVYVFRRKGDTWEQEAYIKASNADPGDGFGSAVALDGDWLVVGAPGEDSFSRGSAADPSNNQGTQTGAVYVFQRNGTSWEQQAYIKAVNADEDDYFGSAVAIYGERFVVGTASESSDARQVGGDSDNNGRSDSGAAYVYKRTEDEWAFEVFLKASNADSGDAFGTSVAIGENVVVVGAPFEDSIRFSDSNANEDAGAIYVFRYSGSSWSEEAYLNASNAESGDRFGASVALSGTNLVAGAPYEDSLAQGVGGDASNNENSLSGAAYVFSFEQNAWKERAYLKATNSDNGDTFGDAVAIEGSFIAVGARNEQGTGTGINPPDDNDELSAGAAYLYHFNGDNWVDHAYIKPPAVYNDGYFGWRLDLAKGTLAVGHRTERGSSKGVDGPLTPATSAGSGSVSTFQ